MANNGIKSLAKETAIYGISTIVGKFCNWLLVPFYSYTITTAEYGVVGVLYAWVALLIIILTYGMETGFFRFAAAQPTEKESNKVYTTTLFSVGFTSLLFIALFAAFNQPIAALMKLPDYHELVLILGITVAFDAFSSIPFSYLRYKQRPVKFMIIKLITIFGNIFCVVFFLWICPKIYKTNPDLISWFFNPNYKVGYIVISNLIATLAGFIALLPDIFVAKWRFDFALLKKMLRYSLPLLMLGVVGIMNQTIDRILFSRLYLQPEEVWQSEMGIYQACFKVAMVMMMFTYAFRFAYEPFIFAQKESKDNKQMYSLAMTYFVISSMLIYLFLIAGLDILKSLLSAEFGVGIGIIPFVLITYFFQGVYYNLSLWYKLIDKTIWGTWISLIGFAITLILNIIFVPKYSYWACVFASLITFFIIMLLCYFLGQKYYPIQYKIKKMVLYFVAAIALSVLMLHINFGNIWLTFICRTAVLTPFVIYILKYDVPIKELAIFKKKGLKI